MFVVGSDAGQFAENVAQQGSTVIALSPQRVVGPPSAANRRVVPLNRVAAISDVPQSAPHIPDKGVAGTPRGCRYLGQAGLIGHAPPPGANDAVAQTMSGQGTRPVVCCSTMEQR